MLLKTICKSLCLLKVSEISFSKLTPSRLIARAPSLLGPVSVSLALLDKRAIAIGIVSKDPYVYDVAAKPRGPLPTRTSGDAPWTQAESSYQRMITCPRGIKQKEKGIILLVPGTASNGSETYERSPYYQGLPSFDLCWIDLPNYSLSDMQLAAEFVAYGIKSLAPKSTATGGKINVVSYSQGGPNVQWASTFWPSLQPLVSGHVAIAPSFLGTYDSAIYCPLSAGFGGCVPSLLQQAKSSTYMNAANSKEDTRSAAYALIPTTVIYSYTDGVVTPQVGPEASSRLIGASNIGLQDICGPWHTVGHFFIVSDMGAYGIALDALTNGRPAQASTIDRAYCFKSAQSVGFVVGNLPNDLAFAYRSAIGDQRGAMIADSLRTLRGPVEPPLQQYVCNRGYATQCTQNGFEGKASR